MSKFEETMEKTASIRGYIYLGICCASLLYRAAVRDTEGMLLSMMVIPLCLLMILKES